MRPSILEISVNLTTEQIKIGRLNPSQAIPYLHGVFSAILGIGYDAVSDNGHAAPKPQFKHWRRTIRKHHIICLECGAYARQITGRHLATHGLTAKTYRKRYNMPHTQGLVCKETTAARRAIVQQVRLCEKSPTSVAAQKRAIAQRAMGRKRTRKHAAS